MCSVRARGDDRDRARGRLGLFVGQRADADCQHHQAAARLLVLVAAVRQWRGRPREGETPKLPRWMGTIDSFTARKSLAIGVLLSAVNPKNLAMSVAAGLAIAQAAIPTGQEVVVLIIYILIGASGVLVPVIVYFAMGDRAATILGGWRKWLEENNAVVTAIVLLVLAAVLIGQGITGLS
jgi:threonine/homoserine/homoserine lactone efflux protein